MTAAEAVKRARLRALKLDADDGEMLSILIDHIGQLERAISLARSGHETFVRHLPDATAVHEVDGPVSMATKPILKKKD